MTCLILSSKFLKSITNNKLIDPSNTPLHNKLKEFLKSDKTYEEEIIKYFSKEHFRTRNTLKSMMSQTIDKFEIYSQYYYAYSQYIANKNVSGNHTNIKLLRSSEILLFPSKYITYKNNLIFNHNFNDALYGNSLKPIIVGLNELAVIKQQIKTFTPHIAQIWVFYDSLGRRIGYMNSNPYDNSQVA